MLMYLYHGFITNFSEFFKVEKIIENKSNIKKKCYYTFRDNDYRSFMNKVLNILEPFYEKKRTVLVEELEEIQMIHFVTKGTVGVGYEINNQKFYILKFENRCVMGSYEIMFNRRSKFCYASLTDIEGYFVRKENWE